MKARRRNENAGMTAAAGAFPPRARNP